MVNPDEPGYSKKDSADYLTKKCPPAMNTWRCVPGYVQPARRKSVKWISWGLRKNRSTGWDI